MAVKGQARFAVVLHTTRLTARADVVDLAYQQKDMVISMKPTTTKPNFQEIKSAVPVDIALVHYGITIKAQGKRLIGCCPIHNGSNPKAFVVSADRKAWHCFGDCSRGGTVLDLVMALENCTLTEAAAIIVKRYGLTA